jgi:hypothetical protein
VIIKDLAYKESHRLTKTRLSEPISHVTGYPWYALLKDIRISFHKQTGLVRVYGRDGYGCKHKCFVDFFPDKQKIGCRVFSPVNFAKILKAAGVRKTNKKPKKVAR